jgi:CRISPR/Cas system-associated endonuclease/helicase Cas3
MPMLSNKEVDKLIKQQITRIKNTFESNINKLERVLLDPTKSITEKMTILATTLELRQGNPKIH